MPCQNLDKLGGIAKRAFNNAANERRKALTRKVRGKPPAAVATLNLMTAGAEFFVWNEESPLVPKRNASDPWYSNFFVSHTEMDGFAAKASEMLNWVRITGNNRD